MTILTVAMIFAWILMIGLGEFSRSVRNGVDENPTEENKVGGAVVGCLTAIPMIITGVMAIIFPLIAWKYDPNFYVSIVIGVWGLGRLILTILKLHKYQRMVKDGELKEMPKHKRKRLETWIYQISFLLYLVYILVFI